MKKCPYCGKEYPDDAVVCATDQYPLDGKQAGVVSTQGKSPSAGFGIRALARIIDTIFALLVGFAAGMAGGIVIQILKITGFITTGWQHRLHEFSLTAFGLSLLGNIAYHTPCEGLHGATLGKLCCGICVVTEDGKPSTLKGALIRTLAFYIDGLFFGLVGYNSMQKSPLNQRYGDVWGKTAVFKVNEMPSESERPIIRFALGMSLGAGCFFVMLVAGLIFKVSGSDMSAMKINGTARNRDITASAVLPFQVTTVWPDAESKEMHDRKFQAKVLLEAKNYGQLDELAGELRSSKESYPNGYWKLADIYDGLVPSDKASDDEWETRVVVLQDWVAARPDSITARVGLANVLVNYAWKARGSDYANTVTDEGWRLFGKRLNQAMKVLNEAENLKEQCPHLWTVKMRAALGLQVDKDQFNDIFSQSTNYASDYERSYLQRAVYLMPRWYGAGGELETDLEKSADQIGGDDGDMLYAQVVWGIHARASSPNVFKENQFSWPRVDRGFAVIEKHFPDSLAAKSERAYLASYAGDVQKTREYLNETQGEADLAVWYYKDEYMRVANWAYGQ
jgi:uncharacterized RDD family membrane protein YckC